MFILDCRNNVRQKANLSDFLIRDQNGSESSGDNSLHQQHLGTLNEHTVQWWFKKFFRGNESLEYEEHSGWPSEVDNDQLKGPSRLMLLQLHEKLPKNSVSTMLWSFSI